MNHASLVLTFIIFDSVAFIGRPYTHGHFAFFLTCSQLLRVNHASVFVQPGLVQAEEMQDSSPYPLATG